MSTSRGSWLLLLSALALISACKGEAPADSQTQSQQDQQKHIQEVVAAGGVVDSILPIAVQLDRFRADITDHPDTLRHASTSRDVLVARWAKAVATSDTTDLNAMVLDRAEFAWLYYPGSSMSKPPYEAPPQLLWGQILASSNAGAQSALRKMSGQKLAVVSVKCPEAPLAEGSNLLHQRCTVRLTDAGRPLPEIAYFGTIVERDHRFKFLGLANNL